MSDEEPRDEQGSGDHQCTADPFGWFRHSPQTYADTRANYKSAPDLDMDRTPPQRFESPQLCKDVCHRHRACDCGRPKNAVATLQAHEKQQNAADWKVDEQHPLRQQQRGRYKSDRRLEYQYTCGGG